MPTTIKRPPALLALAAPRKGTVLFFGAYGYVDGVPVLYGLV
jgi:hypothetical protein